MPRAPFKNDGVPLVGVGSPDETMDCHGVAYPVTVPIMIRNYNSLAQTYKKRISL